jgi:hypothetical protein
MAKKKSYPKAPKKTASLETWNNYKKKCVEVDAANKKMEADKKAKESVIKAVSALKKK